MQLTLPEAPPVARSDEGEYLADVARAAGVSAAALRKHMARGWLPRLFRVNGVITPWTVDELQAAGVVERPAPPEPEPASAEGSLAPPVEMISVRRLAELAAVSVGAVYKWIRNGTVPLPERAGRGMRLCMYWPADQVRALIEGRTEAEREAETGRGVEAMYTPSDLCKLFKIARRTLFRWLETGSLMPPLRPNNRVIRWRRADIAALLERLDADRGGYTTRDEEGDEEGREAPCVDPLGQGPATEPPAPSPVAVPAVVVSEEREYRRGDDVDDLLADVRAVLGHAATTAELRAGPA